VLSTTHASQAAPGVLFLVGDPGCASPPTPPLNSTGRTMAFRPTAARRSRLHRAALSQASQAGERLDTAAHRRRPHSLMSERERADERLADAHRASVVREPVSHAERLAARLEAAVRRGHRRPCLGAQDLATKRLQEAARQRKRRASMTEAKKAAVRLADAKRKREMRSSRAYAAMSPTARWREKGRRGQHPWERPFVGVDGEAGYVHNPWCTRDTCGWCRCPQYYAALTAGDKTLCNPDGSPLSTWQCLEFLTSLPPARYVGYFFDFDATHILRDLPSHILRDIVYPDCMRIQRPDKSVMVRDPVTGRVYLIRHIPHKFLKVVRVGEQLAEPLPGRKPRRVGGRSIVINDCSGYWQTSFYNAITTWNIGSSDEWAVIEAWKAKRNDFVLPLDPELIDYNVLECKLLAELMTKLDQTALGLGIRMERYHGAGTLAEALLIKHGVDAFRSEDDSHPPDLDLAIKCAFFGGRFESAVVGIVPTLHVWDIASAYPAAIVTLPCLRHGRWIHHEQAPLLSRLADSTMVRVRWDVWPSEQRPFGPLPYRREDQELLYPLSGEGWYWVEEVRAAINYCGVDGFDVLDAWEWTQECEHHPFEWVPNLYGDRQRLGKNTAGMVLKYGMNSLYGKMAQTLGGGGRFTEFIWAGMITARTRARLLDVAALGGEDVVMFATDGVGFLRIPDALSEVDTHARDVPLGGWEYAPTGGGVRRQVLLVQSGFYIETKPRRDATAASQEFVVPRDRARGIGKQILAAMDGRTRLVRAFRSDGVDAKVGFGPKHCGPGHAVPMLFMALKSAFHRNQPELAGTWFPVEKTVSFDPRPKREPLPRRAGETFVRTMPAMNGNDPSPLGVMPKITVPSAPYRRGSGNRLDKDLYFDQPDHVDGLAQLVGDD
jgi:DNA polymerase type B, organellar and viral